MKQRYQTALIKKSIWDAFLVQLILVILAVVGIIATIGTSYTTTTLNFYLLASGLFITFIVMLVVLIGSFMFIDKVKINKAIWYTFVYLIIDTVVSWLFGFIPGFILNVSSLAFINYLIFEHKL